jgi:hypothetical protein
MNPKEISFTLDAKSAKNECKSEERLDFHRITLLHCAKGNLAEGRSGRLFYKGDYTVRVNRRQEKRGPGQNLPPIAKLPAWGAETTLTGCGDDQAREVGRIPAWR